MATTPHMLVVRRRNLQKDAFEDVVNQLQSLGLDAYTAKLKLQGEGLAIVNKGEKQSLLELAAPLSAAGFDWALIPPKPPKREINLVKSFKPMNDRLLLEGSFGAISLKKGARLLVVFADIKGRLAKKIMSKSMVSPEKAIRLSTREKYNTVVTGAPVVDFYLLPDEPEENEERIIGPYRFLAGKFSPKGLGKHATASSTKNLDMVVRLLKRYAGEFILELDFGIANLPGCHFDTSGQPEALQKNLDILSAYGWYVFNVIEQSALRLPPLIEANVMPLGMDTGADGASGAQGGEGVDAGRLAPLAAASEIAREFAQQYRSEARRRSASEEAPEEAPLPPPPDMHSSDSFFKRHYKQILRILLILLFFGSGTFLLAAFDWMGRAVYLFFFHKGIGLFILSALFLYGSFRLLRIKRMMDNTPTSKARSAAMGFVEMAGVARRAYALFSPVTNLPCVYYHARKYKKRRRENKTEWTLVKTLRSGAVPFYLEDETGSVYVEPEGATIKAGVTQTIHGGAGLSMLSGGGQSIFDDDSKWVETTIPEGSALYILGWASPRREERAPLRRRVAERLRLLKKDQVRMMEYDTDGDGRIDTREWEKARSDMESEALHDSLKADEKAKEAGLNLKIAKSKDTKGPFIIASGSEERLSLSYKIWGIVSFVASLATVVVGMMFLFDYWG